MKFKNVRCNICSHVSHGEIATEYEDHFPGSFSPDPKGFGYLCFECSSAVQDIKADWQLQDELEGREKE